jgi:hypothetical protein
MDYHQVILVLYSLNIMHLILFEDSTALFTVQLSRSLSIVDHPVLISFSSIYLDSFCTVIFMSETKTRIGAPNHVFRYIYGQGP